MHSYLLQFPPKILLRGMEIAMEAGLVHYNFMFESKSFQMIPTKPINPGKKLILIAFVALLAFRANTQRNSSPELCGTGIYL